MDSQEYQKILQFAADELKSGNILSAREVLIKLVRENPNNAAAWYGLSLAVDDPKMQLDCIHRVLNLNPDFPGAKQRYQELINASNRKVESPGSSVPQGSTSSITKQAQKDIPIAVKTAPKSLDGKTIQRLRETHTAGKSTFEMAQARKKKLWRVAGIYMVLLVICIPVGFIFDPLPALIVVAALFIGSQIIMKYADRMKVLIARAQKGAKGEVKAASLLRNLGKDFRVLHDVVSPFGNIDHVVISKSGVVFAIETKSHNGRVKVENEVILVNGKPAEKNFIAQTLRNVYWLREKIKQVTGSDTYVYGIIVFTNAYVEFTKPVKGIIILNKKFLLEAIQKNSLKNPENEIIRDKVVDLLLEIA